jgi:hypothetical protein
VRDNNHTRRLAKVAAPLEPVRPPWFVRQPAFRSRTPSMGWWWIPAGHEHPVFLGHNHIIAEVQLLGLIESLEKPVGT